MSNSFSPSASSAQVLWQCTTERNPWVDMGSLTATELDGNGAVSNGTPAVQSDKSGNDALMWELNITHGGTNLHIKHIKKSKILNSAKLSYGVSHHSSKTYK